MSEFGFIRLLDYWIHPVRDDILVVNESTAKLASRMGCNMSTKQNSTNLPVAGIKSLRGYWRRFFINCYPAYSVVQTRYPSGRFIRASIASALGRYSLCINHNNHTNQKNHSSDYFSIILLNILIKAPRKVISPPSQTRLM
jgi:hypothetical protein